MTGPMTSMRTAALFSAVFLAACGGPGGRPGGDGAGPGRADTQRDPALTHGAMVVKPEALLIADLDFDGDRVTGRADLARALPALFAEIDTDASSVIGGVEYAAWAQTTLGTRYPVLGLAHFDADNSLTIERAEFDTGMQALFTRLDTDGDDRVTRTDLFTAINIPIQGGGRGGGGIAGRSGGGRDGGGRGGQRPAT